MWKKCERNVKKWEKRRQSKNEHQQKMANEFEIGRFRAINMFVKLKREPNEMEN